MNILLLDAVIQQLNRLRIYSKLNIPRCQIWIFKKKTVSKSLLKRWPMIGLQIIAVTIMGRQPWANLSRLEEAQSQGLGRPQALRCTTHFINSIHSFLLPTCLADWLLSMRHYPITDLILSLSTHNTPDTINWLVYKLSKVLGVELLAISWLSCPTVLSLMRTDAHQSTVSWL